LLLKFFYGLFIIFFIFVGLNYYFYTNLFEMRGFVFVVFVVLGLFFGSCRNDFETVASDGKLEFSSSKIFLDTVFNNIGSSTYGLKVYNRSNNDIKIPIIQFGKGTTTKYRMMVDGMTGEDADHNGIGDGKVFNNVEILAKDSLFVFIEITNNVSGAVPTEFTYNDQILFDLGSKQQKVDLTTLIWDAKFIFPNRTLPNNVKELLSINATSTDIVGHRLNDNDFSPAGSWHITNLKPTVVYGYMLVPDGKVLTIDRGASLYFHADGASGLIVENGGRLVVDGGKNVYDSTGLLITKNEVTMEADRLEPFFEDVPGQWGGVFIISNKLIAAPNAIKYLKLKNSTFGFYTQNIDGVGGIENLDIQNSQIYNSSAFGLLNRNTKVTGKNLVVNNCGQANVASVGGGYDFVHCTFNNNWFSSKQRAVILYDYYQDNLNVVQPLSINASFKNCIIFGSANSVELELDYKFSTTAPLFDHCLIKFNDANTKYANLTIYNNIRSGNAANVNANISNITDAKFKNATKNQLNILGTSPAVGTGNFFFSGFNDILNLPRTNPSDIGAYNKP
jgi:hypothetical protein